MILKKSLFYLLLREELIKRKRSALSSYIDDINKSSYLVKDNKRIVYHTISGISQISRLNGTILVPINDLEIEVLNRGTGIATLLDGGFVSIIGIFDSNEISDEGYLKVCEISTEKKIYDK